MASRCNVTTCKYHGIECCMLKGDPVIDNMICVSYAISEPVHIQPSDLLPPFDAGCHKGKSGKYHSDNPNPGKVLK